MFFLCLCDPGLSLVFEIYDCFSVIERAMTLLWCSSCPSAVLEFSSCFPPVVGEEHAVFVLSVSFGMFEMSYSR